MLKEAKAAGHIKIDNVEFGQNKIQIITIEQMCLPPFHINHRRKN